MPEFSLSRKLVAEFLGTALLLASVVGSGIMGDTLSQGNDGIALMANMASVGAILIVLIKIFGPISGAHFNPAVTLSFLIQKEIDSKTSLYFILVQIVGGLAGVFAAHYMFAQEIVQASTHIRTGPNQWFSEIIATFGLVATIIGTVKFNKEAVAYTVGLYISSAYWFTASTSFANPAVTIARSFSDTFAGIAPSDVTGFIIAQFWGAIFATYLFKWLLKK